MNYGMPDYLKNQTKKKKSKLPKELEPYQDKMFNPYGIFQGIFIPNFILDSDMTPTTKILFGRLIKFCGKKGFCYPKTITIADSLKISKRQVIRSINELVEQGFVIKVRRGQMRSNYYILDKNNLLKYRE